MQDKFFLHRDVLKIFPWLKVRTLMWWSERGLIKPFRKAAGRGSERVYSYKNLIEIGILSELLQHGITIRNCEYIMQSEGISKVLKSQSLDDVFWFDRQLISADVPMDKAPPFVGSYGFVAMAEFLKKGGTLLFGSGRDLVTSIIIINLGGLKFFIDNQLKKVRT